MNIEKMDVRKSQIFEIQVFDIHRKHGFINVGEKRSAISEASAFSIWPETKLEKAPPYPTITKTQGEYYCMIQLNVKCCMVLMR